MSKAKLIVGAIKGGGETGWWRFAGNFRDKESGDLLSLQQLITKFSLDEKRFAAGAVLFQFDPKHLLVETHKTTALDGVPFAEWSPAQGLFGKTKGGKTKGGENEVVTGPLPYSSASDIEVIL